MSKQTARGKRCRPRNGEDKRLNIAPLADEGVQPKRSTVPPDREQERSSGARNEAMRLTRWRSGAAIPKAVPMTGCPSIEEDRITTMEELKYLEQESP